MKLGQVQVGSNVARNHSSSPWKSYMVIIYPIHMKSLPKVKLGQVQISYKIAQNHSSSHRKSYLVIICPNSHQKLTKSEIRSNSSRFKTLLRITHLAHKKSYLVIIGPNSHEKLSKRSNSSRFEHCSESPI